jgi:hypothetical protein
VSSPSSRCQAPGLASPYGIHTRPGNVQGGPGSPIAGRDRLDLIDVSDRTWRVRRATSVPGRGVNSGHSRSAKG